MAMPHAHGAIRIGNSMAHESIIGSRFTGSIVGTAMVAGRLAILPTREGRAGTGRKDLARDSAQPNLYALTVAMTLAWSAVTFADWV
jgi:proline racemase